MIITITGPPGCGKSTVARLLAEKLTLEDCVRKIEKGLSNVL